MENILLVIHTLVAVGLVGVVLLQRSEGGALGIGGGGGGGGGGMFSSRTAANLLTRATAILAAVFFVTSIALTVLHNNAGDAGSIADRIAPIAPIDGDAGDISPDLAPAPIGTPDAAPAAPAAPDEPSVPLPQ